MRSRQAFKNMAASLILQVIVFLSGIILPRFFLEAYGSSVNGLVTSANQFLMYLGLAESGIGTASVVALYNPLAHGERQQVDAILSATRRFYNKISYIFAALVIALAAIFPYVIKEQLPSSLVRSIVIVLGSSMFVNLYFIGKYKVYLTAKQEGYILSIVEAVGTLLNMIVSIVLIRMNFNVIVVKTVATVVFILRFLAIKYYMDKHYKDLDYHAKPDYSSLNQRGPALLHQVVGIIVNNTDVALMTVLMGARSLLEVSVYGIYNMVVYALNMLLNAFSNGLTAGFGEVISKKEEDTLRESFSSYEYVYFIVLFIICTCMGVLLLPFVTVYTINMTDVNYIRPLTAGLFVVIVFLQNVRIPGLTIICAAGHFKETQGQAVLEAAINLSVSIALIGKLGLNGALIGTICSYGYRAVIIMLYNDKYLVKRSRKKTFLRILRNAICMAALILAGLYVVPQVMGGFGAWIMYGAVMGVISVCVFVGVNYVFEAEEFKKLFARFHSIR